MGRFSTWNNVPNCPVFPNILFSFSYNLVMIQCSLPQGKLQAIQSSHFKKETLQLPSLTETFLLSLCSPLTSWENIEYLCFYSASLTSSEQHWVTLLSLLQFLAVPLLVTPVQVQHQPTELWLFRAHSSSLSTFLPTFELATSVMASSQPKCRIAPIWKGYQPCFTYFPFWHMASLAPPDLFLPSLSIIFICPPSVRASTGPKVFDIFYSPLDPFLWIQIQLLSWYWCTLHRVLLSK